MSSADVIGLDHPEAFSGIEKREPSHYRLKPEQLVECPRCKGHGKWNSSRTDEAGRYHRQACSNCWSWGYVEAGSLDATCFHEWNVRSLAMCDHLWTCKHCGRERRVDSSD